MEDRGTTHGLTFQGRTGYRKPHGRSEMLGCTDGGAEGLKGASRGVEVGMAGSGRVCRRAGVGEEGGFVKDRAGGDNEHSGWDLMAGTGGDEDSVMDRTCDDEESELGEISDNETMQEGTRCR